MSKLGSGRRPDCHPDRPHKGHGLCNACYKRQHESSRRATCHPDRPHEARGLCARCYELERNREPGVLERIKVNRRARYKKNPEKFLRQVKRWRATNYTRAMYLAARKRASEYGVSCTITEADIVIPATCPLLGIRLECGTQRHKDSSPTLDRVDPSGGYDPHNVWVISYRANRIKNDGTLEELRLIADGVAARLRA